MDNTNWFFPDGKIKLFPSEAVENENTILFSITFWLRNNMFTPKQLAIVLSYIGDDGQIKTTRSHDNTTAIICYLHCYQEFNKEKDTHANLLEEIRKVKIFPNHTHPRDIIWIGYLQQRAWAYFLLPLLIPIFLFMAIKKNKVRPTLSERLKNGWFFGKLVDTINQYTNNSLLKEKIHTGTVRVYFKKGIPNYSIRTFTKTDTEILYWIRLKTNTIFMKLTHKLIEPFLVKRFGLDWFDKTMAIYYQEGHPNIAS